MCHIGAWPKIHIHLTAHCRSWALQEEARMGSACYTPNDIWVATIVPSCGGFNYIRCSIWGWDIGTDVVEALGSVCCAGLSRGYVRDRLDCAVEGIELALISCSAVSNLETLRATIMIFAPFTASCFATLIPIPSDAPVRRIVYCCQQLDKDDQFGIEELPCHWHWICFY